MKHQFDNNITCNSQNSSNSHDKRFCHSFSKNFPAETHTNDRQDVYPEQEPQQFVKLLNIGIMEFISRLHIDISIPRVFIQRVVDFVISFLNSGFLDIKSFCLLQMLLIHYLILSLFVILLTQ